MGWGRWGREARLPPAEAEAEAQGSPPEEEDAYHRVEAALLHIEDSCHREGGGFRGGGGGAPRDRIRSQGTPSLSFAS